MIMRLSFIVICISFIFLSTTQTAFACGCRVHSTVLEDFEESDIVVIARLVSLEKADPPEPRPVGGDIKSATMSVEKAYKGDVKVSEKLTFAQGDEVLGCSWSFHPSMIGSQYLLYLYRPEKSSDPWFISTCNRSRDIEYPNDDLLYLNNMDKLRGRTRVSGVLDDDGLGDRTVEGWKIRIIGRNKTYVAMTDRNGAYELYDLPPGKYVLKPELPSGWKVDEFGLTRESTRQELMHGRPPGNRIDFTLRPKKHFGIYIRLRLSNQVSGTIYDSNSKPMQWVCVSLVPVDDEQFLACNSLTDEQGRFQIDSVEAGTYVIILNYENKITTKMPFPKLYYPGVTEREKAQTITVKHGESVENLKLVIKK